MVLDLSTLDTVKAASEEGATLEVRHPTTGACAAERRRARRYARFGRHPTARAKRTERAAIDRRLKQGAGRRGAVTMRQRSTATTH
jgi:hypothetical protein